MRIAYGSGKRRCTWLGLIALAAVLMLPGTWAKAQSPTTAPAAQNSADAAAAVAAAPTDAATAEPAPDYTGAYQLVPTSASTPGFKPVTEKSTPAEMAAAVNAVAGGQARNYFSANFVWVLVAGFLVIFMQAGFALVETGLCRAKNASHTMSMNFAVYGLGMFGFFVCGFALMCGGYNGTAIGGPMSLGGLPTLNEMFTIGTSVATPSGALDTGWGIFGKTGFFLTGKGYDSAAIVMFLFMMAFMDTTATIVTGACAERWSYKSFFIFSILVGGLIYPIFGCWVWGGGWLAQIGYRWGLGHGAVDYAGSGVVHLQGGALAVITSLLIGPRIGKYKKDGSVNPILAHHIPMVQLGTFILAFGWFGFNAGSSLAGTDGRIGVVAVNTMVAGMAATVCGILFMWMTTGKPDPSMMCNSMLAGLVAITAPCAFVSPVGAFIIGAIAGTLVVVSVYAFDKLKIDDPVGASSVHGVCGLFGVLAVGLFADGTYGDGWNLVPGTVKGLFYGGGLSQFWAQCVEGGVCIAWNMVVGGVAFFIIGKLVGNRVPPEVEIAGLDIPEMGAPGYPEFITSMTPEDVPRDMIEAALKGDAVPAMSAKSASLAMT